MSELPGRRIAGLPSPTVMVEGDQLVRKGSLLAALQAQPTNQGTVSVLWRSRGPNATQISTNSFVVLRRRNAADTADEDISGTFEAPYAGTYWFVWSVTAAGQAGGSSTNFKIEITGATVLSLDGVSTIPADSDTATAWVLHFGSSDRDSNTFAVPVALNAGTHTFTPYWRKPAASNAANNDQYGRFEAFILGMGGTATVFQQSVRDAQHTASVTSTFSGNPSAWQDIQAGITDDNGGANLISVPATGQYVFRVHHQAAFASGDFARYQYRLLIDGAQEVTNSSFYSYSATGNIVSISGTALAQLTVGTHTWKLQWRRHDGSGQLTVTSGINYRFSLTITGGAAFNAAIVDPPILTPPNSSELIWGDEFSTAVLDPAWTLTAGAGGGSWAQVAVDPDARFTASPNRYDLTSRPGWLTYQPFIGSLGAFFSRSVTLTTNATLVARVQHPTSYRAPATNSFQLYLFLDDGTGTNRVLAGYDNSGGTWQLRALFAGGGGADNIVSVTTEPHKPALIMVVKVGTRFRVYIDGKYMGSGTFGATLNRVVITSYAIDHGFSVDPDPNPIYSVDFVRVYNTARFF